MKIPYRITRKKTDYKKYVQEKHNLPLGLPELDISLFLSDSIITIYPYTYLEGTSLPTDIALLNALAKRHEKCSYFEIGTWRGESIANVSKHAHQCVSLSLSEKEMLDIGNSQAFVELNRFYSKSLANVKHIEHNSLTYDFNKIKQRFDLIFIDGDHSHSSIKSDTLNSYHLMKQKDSVMVWHDYGRTTESVNWETLAGILDGLPKKYHNNLYHVSNTLCAILTLGDYPKEYKSFPSPPSKEFKIDIQIK